MNAYRPGRAVLLGSALTILFPALPCIAAETAESGDEASLENLRERLTEREDETRVEDPWTTDLFGHPLSATLQYELSGDWVRQLSGDDPPDGKTRVLLEQEAEGEIFYTRGPQFSLLLQARAAMEEDALTATRQGLSTRFVERGEMWLYSERVIGSRYMSFEIGRLDFEDDRRWWWDENLDAVRVTAGAGSFELALAIAKELGPARSDRRFIEPDHEGVRRVIAEASWDWHANHSLQLFALVHDDRSRSQEIGATIDAQRKDESDARLRWFGVRATGAWALQSAGIVGYWLDAGRVRGNEVLSEFTASSAGFSVAEEREQQTVRGRGFDAGATWVLPFYREPRLSLGYARGSGDVTADDGHDGAFRQSGLNGNAAGFGGMQSFPGYGGLLDPELSNLQIVTIGTGISTGQASSLDLVYHRYRQVRASDSLEDSRLVASPNGRDRDLGEAVDMVLAVEESDWIEFELSLLAFRAGTAFGEQRGRWAFGAFAALRLAF